MQRRGGMKGGNPININPAHKGMLHQDLGVPAGTRIPEAKLEEGKASPDPKVRRRATFAANAKKFDHSGGQ